VTHKSSHTPVLQQKVYKMSEQLTMKRSCVPQKQCRKSLSSKLNSFRKTLHLRSLQSTFRATVTIYGC